MNSFGGVLVVLGWALLIDAVCAGPAFLVALAVHSRRPLVQVGEEVAEARHRRAMEAYTLRLGTWLEASRARPGVASTPPDPELWEGRQT